jgi:ATP-dependent DNA ligase
LGYARIVSIPKGKVGFVAPMLALAVTKLPEGPAWTYELKFDGYRALGVKASDKVRLFSRNGKDFTRRFDRSRDHWKRSPTMP